jgi:hypothetical protein
MRASLLAALALACQSSPPPSPFSPAEVERALAPVKQVEARCYGASQSGRDAQKVELGFRLEIEPSGRVQAIPTRAKPHEPALVECVRHGLNELSFPARGRDHLELNLELGAAPRARSGS